MVRTGRGRGDESLFEKMCVEEGIALDSFLDDGDDMPVDLEPISCRDTDPIPGLACERDTLPCPPPDMDVVIDLLRVDEDEYTC